MYHIKDDIRARKSAQLLYQGLSVCMNNMEFSKISVSDISKVSTVSRATFYRGFDEILDILFWKCDTQFVEMLSAYVAQKKEPESDIDFLLHVFRYWETHSEIISQLISINRLDIIFRCFLERSPIVVDYFKSRNSASEEVDDAYFLAVRVGIFIGVIKTWIDRGRKENAEELTRKIVEQFQFLKKSEVLF